MYTTEIRLEKRGSWRSAFIFLLLRYFSSTNVLKKADLQSLRYLFIWSEGIFARSSDNWCSFPGDALVPRGPITDAKSLLLIDTLTCTLGRFHWVGFWLEFGDCSSLFEYVLRFSPHSITNAWLLSRGGF